MYLDGNSNISNLNNVSCATVSATGSIYISNSSPIYLKTTDPNHYIKYNSVYDGSQIGFFTGII